MDYDNTNRGVLFQENEKESEKHPDYTGKLNVEGKEYRLAGWKRLSKSNKPFLSLSISEPKPKQDGAWAEAGKKFKDKEDEAPAPDFNENEPLDLSDIPF